MPNVGVNTELRGQALNLALTYHRQNNKDDNEDRVVEISEKFYKFLKGEQID